MKLPIFTIREGFVEGVTAQTVATETAPVFVYDTENCERIVVNTEQGKAVGDALAGMARLMGIPCAVVVSIIRNRVTVFIPFRMNEETVERDMTLDTIGNVTVVGFKPLAQLTAELFKGRA